MIDLTAGTDVGNVLNGMMRDNLTSIKEGVDVLRTHKLKAANDQVKMG